MGGRAEKGGRNALYSLAYQAVYLVCTFVTRIAMIRFAGMEAMSVNSLLMEAVTFLSVAELGIWSAISYNLYKPLAEGDEDKLVAVMTLFRRAYTVIGIATAVIGAALAPAMPLLLKDIDVDTGYFLCAYALVLAKGTVPYFFSYKMALLNADQRNWEYIRWNIVLRLAFFAAELAVLVATGDLLAYLAVNMLGEVSTFASASVVADRRYPFLRERAALPREERDGIFANIRRVFVGKVANKVLNATDNILISTIVGTLMVGAYAQYSMFINGFLRLFVQVCDSLTGSIGNLLAAGDGEHSKRVFDNLTYFFFASSCIVASCFIAGIDPFLVAAVGKDYTLPFPVLLAASFVMFLEIVKMPLWNFYVANGMFESDQAISLAGCAVNLAASIGLGIAFGMVGIFAGTVTALAVMMAGKAFMLYRDGFGQPWARGLARYAAYAAIGLASLALSYHAGMLTEGLPHLLRFAANCGMAAVISGILSIVPFAGSPQLCYWLGKAKDLIGKLSN